jgi:hypothetical protein
MSDHPREFWEHEVANNTAQQESAVQSQSPPIELRLVSKKIPIRYCEFKISNTQSKMLKSDSQVIAGEGIQFAASVAFTPGTILRVWIEIPDFWSRKSRHVGYKHTDAPKWFQMLARVITCEEAGKRGNKFQLTCESVNMDPDDQVVLNEYLGLGR